MRTLYFTPFEGDDFESGVAIIAARKDDTLSSLQNRINQSPSTLVRATEDADETSPITFDDLPSERKPSRSSQEDYVREGIMPKLAYATRFDALKDLAENALPLRSKKSGKKKNKRGRAKSPQRSLIDEPPTSGTKSDHRVDMQAYGGIDPR